MLQTLRNCYRKEKVKNNGAYNNNKQLQYIYINIYILYVVCIVYITYIQYIQYINRYIQYVYNIYTQAVRGFQLPFFRHPPLDPIPPPLFKIFVSPLLFSVPPPFKVFQKFPHPHTTPSCPKQKHQPSLHIITGFNKYQKGDFIGSVVVFYQYQVILIYGIFSGSFFDNLEWLLFIKF